MSKNFSPIVVCDFEYEVPAGNLPDVFCMVAHVLDENLRHVHRLWRGEFGKTPPFDIGPDALFVAYSAWAEMTCFKVLGWQFPVHIFDLHTAYLAASNILLPYSPDEVRNKPRKRLSDACDAYDLEGWKGIDKDAIAERIGNGTWREYHSPEEVLDYNEEDVRMELRLLRAQLLGRPGLLPASVPHVLHWSNYSAKCIALIQARGMPIDMVLWHLVQENKAAIIGELLRRFDPSYGSDDPIFSPEGKFSYRRFEHWLVRTGVTTWPRLPSGQLDLDGDAFRLMSYVPGVEVVHALRDSLNFIRRELPIGTDGRNRPSLFPFGTMRIGTASTMPMPACVPSWCFRRALSAPIWIGAPKRLALPLPCPAILHCWPTMPPAISIMHWHECAGSPMTRIRCIGSRLTGHSATA